MELVKREPEVDQLTGNAPRLIRNPNLNHQPEVDQVTENGSSDQLTGGESAGWMEVVKGEPEMSNNRKYASRSADRRRISWQQFYSRCCGALFRWSYI